MLRFLFSAGAVFVLVISMCLLPQTAAARRCPVKEPETLLSLYQNSDAIYVAAFDKVVDGEILETTEDYTSLKIEKHFTITSALKGPSRKFFTLEDRDYRYKAAAPEPGEEAEEEYDEDDSSAELKSGDTLLLFLKKAEDIEEDEENTKAPAAMELTDYRDGIKKLSVEEIGVYEARIKDLNSIFSDKKVSDSRLLEWLIRCAEDPATRWEGTYELLQSVRNLEWVQQAAEKRKSRIANGLPVEEEADAEDDAASRENGDAEESVHKNVDTRVFAKIIDAGQKQQLANILLNNVSAKPAEGEQAERIAGETELIELVRRWGDPRLVGFLIDRLRAGSEEPYFAAETMGMIAQIVNDKDLTGLAEKYSETGYEDDDAIVETSAEETEQAVPEAETSKEELPESSEPPAEPASKEADVNDDETDEPKIKKITYKELRAELMQKFLVQCDRVLADGNAEKKAK